MNGLRYQKEGCVENANLIWFIETTQANQIEFCLHNLAALQMYFPALVTFITQLQCY